MAQKVIGGRCGCDGPVCGPPNPTNKRRRADKKADKKKQDSKDKES
ncbi:MAG: hypothetical protein WDZ40_04080 [Candidatus Spechtbacterales bacterium]